MDQDSTFMSSLISYLFKKLDIIIKNSSTLRSLAVMGKTWNQITINNFNETFDKFKADMAEILTSGYICL